jgi:hypothetical protein
MVLAGFRAYDIGKGWQGREPPVILGSSAKKVSGGLAVTVKFGNGRTQFWRGEEKADIQSDLILVKGRDTGRIPV